MKELALRNNDVSSLKIFAFASPSSHNQLELGLTCENSIHFASEINVRFDLKIVNIDVLASSSCSLPFHVSDNEAIAESTNSVNHAQIYKPTEDFPPCFFYLAPKSKVWPLTAPSSRLTSFIPALSSKEASFTRIGGTSFSRFCPNFAHDFLDSFNSINQPPIGELLIGDSQD
ncbi:hypothetical protein L1887_27216 [Cichorium endivia]|nr:hypothetical protein L1887_27216 [Cichorium endivia]